MPATYSRHRSNLHHARSGRCSRYFCDAGNYSRGLAYVELEATEISEKTLRIDYRWSVAAGPPSEHIAL